MAEQTEKEPVVIPNPMAVNWDSSRPMMTRLESMQKMSPRRQFAQTSTMHIIRNPAEQAFKGIRLDARYRGSLDRVSGNADTSN